MNTKKLPVLIVDIIVNGPAADFKYFDTDALNDELSLVTKYFPLGSADLSLVLFVH